MHLHEQNWEVGRICVRHAPHFRVPTSNAIWVEVRSLTWAGDGGDPGHGTRGSTGAGGKRRQGGGMGSVT